MLFLQRYHVLFSIFLHVCCTPHGVKCICKQDSPPFSLQATLCSASAVTSGFEAKVHFVWDCWGHCQSHSQWLLCHSSETRQYLSPPLVHHVCYYWSSESRLVLGGNHIYIHSTKRRKKGENKIKINFLPDNFLGSEIRVT